MAHLMFVELFLQLLTRPLQEIDLLVSLAFANRQAFRQKIADKYLNRNNGRTKPIRRYGAIARMIYRKVLLVPCFSVRKVSYPSHAKYTTDVPTSKRLSCATKTRLSCSFDRNHLRARSQAIGVIRPSLHHLAPLVQILRFLIHALDALFLVR